MQRFVAISLVALAFVIAPRVARADAIGPPPSDCAPGSMPHSTHGGEWCEDSTCATDADCARWQGFSYGFEGVEGASYSCLRVSACVAPGTRPTGPQSVDSERGGYTVAGRPVHGACDAAGACAEGRCEQARRCVPSSLHLADEPEIAERAPAPAEPVSPHTQQTRGGGCAIGATSGATITGAALALALVALRSRRRATRSG